LNFLRRSQCREAQRGQNLVEFALLAPFLFLLLLGMVDLGRALYYANDLTNAAREGARVAILSTNECNSFYKATTCTASNGNGVTVCDAIEGQSELIGATNWIGCPVSGGDAALDLDGGSGCTATSCMPPSNATAVANSGVACQTTTTPCQNYAYVSIVQATTDSETCSDIATASSHETATTARAAGNLPLRIKIVYYFTPLTGLLGQFFPASFHITATACARAEY